MENMVHNLNILQILRLYFMLFMHLTVYALYSDDFVHHSFNKYRKDLLKIFLFLIRTYSVPCTHRISVGVA